MRRRILLALGAAVLVGGWIMFFEREESDSSDGTPVFAVEAQDVVAFAIERVGEPVVRIERSSDDSQDGDRFTVQEGDEPPAPADSTEVDLLLQNLESLRFEREIPEVGEEQLDGFGLDPPELVVRVTTEAGTSEAGFGDETPAPGNRYLRFGASVLIVPAFAETNFDRTAWDLRDKRVFRFDFATARALRLITESAAVEARREAGGWRIVRPFAFAADAFEASQLANGVLDLEMVGIAPASDDGADPFGLDAPRLTAEIELEVGTDSASATRTITFGNESSSPAGVFAAVADDPTVFVVASEAVDDFIASAENGLADLRSLRLFGFAAFRVVELRAISPDDEAVFTREDGPEGRVWTVRVAGAEPTPVDSVRVEDLLYELTSADAEAVGETALLGGDTSWVLTVTEEVDDGASEETLSESVRIAVSEAGEAHALRSEDERTLVLGPEAWAAISELLTAARTPPDAPESQR